VSVQLKRPLPELPRAEEEEEEEEEEEARKGMEEGFVTAFTKRDAPRVEG